MAVLRMAARAKLGLLRRTGQAGEGTRRFGPRLGRARQARRTLAGLEDAGRLVRHTGEVIGQANGLLTALVLDALPRRAPARPIDGAVLRWYGATEDVHDHHEAEAALREGEARFRATFGRPPSEWATSRSMARG